MKATSVMAERCGMTFLGCGFGVCDEGMNHWLESPCYARRTSRSLTCFAITATQSPCWVRQGARIVMR